jgi:hypothetical protein
MNKLLILIIFFLNINLFCCIGSENKGGNNMKNSDEIKKILKLIEIDDKQYFIYLNENPDDNFSNALIDNNFRGFFINAPKIIDLKINNSFPLLLWRQTTDLREWEVSFKLNSTIIVVDLNTNDIFYEHLFKPVKKIGAGYFTKSRTGEKPEADTTAEDYFSGPYFFDLDWLLFRNNLHPSTYALTFINHDYVTNTVITSVIAGSKQNDNSMSYPIDDAVNLAKEIEKNKEGKSYIDYEKHSESPVLKESGIKIQLEQKNKENFIFGTILTKLSDSSIVNVKDNKFQYKLPDAVLKGGLLICELDNPNRLFYKVEIPVFNNKLKSGDNIDAYFSLDLTELLGENIPKNNFLVYFIFNSYIDGPIEIKK